MDKKINKDEVKAEPKEKDPNIFTVGDTVRLLSGGPTMVIENVESDESDMVTVVYFDIAGVNFYRMNISVNVLRHFEPKQ